ncbi:hypothetical protein C4J90_4023 [Pseudomonas sp. R2-60-08W]|nr:hypothetical protein C4J90_4023 [Pseudomonas sp. R2-60-08W]
MREDQEYPIQRENFSNQSAKMQISAGIKPLGGSIFVTELTPRKCQI